MPQISTVLLLDCIAVELKGQVNSFLKRAFKCGFCSKLYTIEAIADDADIDLFRKMANPCHCIHSLLPPVKSCNQRTYICTAQM